MMRGLKSASSSLRSRYTLRSPGIATTDNLRSSMSASSVRRLRLYAFSASWIQMMSSLLISGMSLPFCAIAVAFHRISWYPITTNCITYQDATQVERLSMSILGMARGTRGGQAAKELRKQANHGTVIMGWGRLWAIILLVFFSAGALVTLAGVPMQHIAAAIEAGQPPNVAEAITSATILALVIGMDLAMIIATMMIRAMRARGKGWREWWGYLALALFVGAIEALTFGVMIVNNEHPQG